MHNSTKHYHVLGNGKCATAGTLKPKANLSLTVLYGPAPYLFKIDRLFSRHKNGEKQMLRRDAAVIGTSS